MSIVKTGSLTVFMKMVNFCAMTVLVGKFPKFTVKIPKYTVKLPKLTVKTPKFTINSPKFTIQ
ncbi:hypothetical protein SAMN05216238_101442 [Lentibacillus persicus]|uniref:Uncharacterized protein n=1 Tax=Lentibacillus persicus TaxID=640948 RepID=A0A1I1ST12_9BACI|nr:hypothetical protein SAMN05216238_101442 [Lentibacillus persicus]